MPRMWRFGDDRDGFRFENDLLRFGSEPEYADSWRSEDAGFRGGALALELGGEDGARVADISAGWGREFELDDRGSVTLTFRYKIKPSDEFDAREFSDIRIAIDGEVVEVDGEKYVARVRGDGDGQETGWAKARIDLGKLGAGSHDLDLIGYVSGTGSGEQSTRFYFDNVRLKSSSPEDKLGAFEAEVLRLTNEFREDHGRDPLRSDGRLAAAAEEWSREMARGDFFEHSETRDLVEDEGYEWVNLGENIAAGYATPEDVVEGWIDSPGHRANMLSKDFEELGVGYFFRSGDGGDAPYGHYWTQVFGTEPDNLT